MLGATIQALEVQRMTLATLKTMNLPMSELRDSLKLDPQAYMPKAAPPAAAESEPDADADADDEQQAAAPASAPKARSSAQSQARQGCGSGRGSSIHAVVEAR